MKKNTLFGVLSVLFSLLLFIVFNLTAKPIIVPPLVPTQKTALPEVGVERKPESNVVTVSTLVTPTTPLSPVSREKPGEVIGTAITEENIFNAVNRERYGLGLSILKRNPILDDVAEARLADMLENHYFAHTNPATGEDVFDALPRAGYSFKRGGENLARNFSSVQDVLTAWLQSPTHFDKLSKPDFEETGIAVSGSYVVQVFGRPLRASDF